MQNTVVERSSHVIAGTVTVDLLFAAGMLAVNTDAPVTLERVARFSTDQQQ